MTRGHEGPAYREKITAVPQRAEQKIRLANKNTTASRSSSQEIITARINQQTSILTNRYDDHKYEYGVREKSRTSSSCWKEKDAGVGR